MNTRILFYFVALVLASAAAITSKAASCDQNTTGVQSDDRAKLALPIAQKMMDLTTTELRDYDGIKLWASLSDYEIGIKLAEQLEALPKKSDLRIAAPLSANNGMITDFGQAGHVPNQMAKHYLQLALRNEIVDIDGKNSKVVRVSYSLLLELAHVNLPFSTKTGKIGRAGAPGSYHPFSRTVGYRIVTSFNSEADEAQMRAIANRLKLALMMLNAKSLSIKKRPLVLEPVTLDNMNRVDIRLTPDITAEELADIISVFS